MAATNGVSKTNRIIQVDAHGATTKVRVVEILYGSLGVLSGRVLQDSKEEKGQSAQARTSVKIHSPLTWNIAVNVCKADRASVTSKVLQVLGTAGKYINFGNSERGISNATWIQRDNEG